VVADTLSCLPAPVATPEELAALREERDRLAAALEHAALIVREYAQGNPKWTPPGEEQDPCGAHEWLAKHGHAGITLADCDAAAALGEDKP